jgi:NADH-ubiquinone oxidoreductase chain 3
MTSTTFFFVFIPLLAIILLAVNLIFAPHNPYQEKDSAFECGFHSFLGQNRTQFSISFFIFALLFLLFDLEILLVYPYVVSAYTNGIYGLVIMLIFFLALTLGFAFELGKNALKIESRQNIIKKDNSLTNNSLLVKPPKPYPSLRLLLQSWLPSAPATTAMVATAPTAPTTPPAEVVIEVVKTVTVTYSDAIPGVQVIAEVVTTISSNIG